MLGALSLSATTAPFNPHVARAKAWLIAHVYVSLWCYRLSHHPVNDLLACMQSIVWDRAPMRALGLSAERRFDDAFIVRMVPKDYVHNIAYAPLLAAL